jgi:SAM-dependent methyltransferase
MSYIGNELELFKYAHNWKQYYASVFVHLLKGDVLEVGAGIGETTHSLCNGKQESWVCVEPDPDLTTQIALKKQQGYLPDFIEIVTGTLDAVAADRKFDAILYIDVIEHIEHDGEELLKASQYLKCGGHLIVLVPAHNFLYSEFDKAIGHFRRYNKRRLADAAPKHLKTIDLRYMDSVGLSASLANKWFLKQDYPELKQIQFWDNYIIPVSKIADRITFYKFGKTVVGIWQKTTTE